MRTRDEQISDIFPGYCAEDADETLTKGDLRSMLEYAERRAEQRVRVEIVRDSERLDWLENRIMTKIYKIIMVLFLVAGLIAGIVWAYFDIGVNV